MIKEFKCFTIVCDGCGKDSNEDSGYSGWDDLGYATDVADEADYIVKDDKHYCPNCYEYDDEDELIIKQKKHI